MIFIDVGQHSISLNHVTRIYRASNGGITIEFDVLDGDGPAVVELHGDEAEAFRVWWDRPHLLCGLSIFKICCVEKEVK